MHLTNHLTALTFLTTASAAVLPRQSHVETQPSTGLHDVMLSRGRQWFGTALTIRNDTVEQALVANTAEFGSITPENAMKWESTEPDRNNFTFADADAVAAFAAMTGQQMHCHTLVWHSQLPEWVSEGGYDNATLLQIMETHIREVAGRYKGQCTRWDVVNEALNEDGTYRPSVFFNTTGEAYIPIAFRIAAEVDPDAHLFYNDYNLETSPEKAAGARRIVELIKSYGVRIDGVGLQAHLAIEVTETAETTTPSLDVLTENLRSFTDLGVSVAYTEIDVRMSQRPSEVKLKTQAENYAAIVGSCMAVEGCVGMTAWGVSDAYSWIPYTFSGEGVALMWDEYLRRKPAYYAALYTILG